jgi:hypothetical protein
MVLGALLQIRGCHRLGEHTRTGPPLRMGEVRCKSAVSPDGVIRTLAIDGKCLWSGRLNLFEVVTLDAGNCSFSNANLIDGAGYGYILVLKDNQPELLHDARRVLLPLAATQAPAAKVLERDHGQWMRRSL